MMENTPGAKAKTAEPRPGCPWAESAALHIQGELSGDELSRFDKHLSGCGECRRTVAEFREVIARMRELGPEPAGRDLAPEILARAEHLRPRPSTSSGHGRREHVERQSRRRIVAALALAASLLIALAGFRILAGRSAPRVAEAPPAEVERALEWLASSQEAGGSWDAREWGGQETYTVGLTGLGVLAFVGAGETHLGGPHAKTVERGLGYLVREQGARGRFGPYFGAALYNHGIATVALLELYARTRDAELKPSIGRALAFIRSEQGVREEVRGGWGYLGGGPANTSVTAWQLHALLLGASLDWPEAEGPALSCLERGLAWLEGVVGADGLAGYRRPGDCPNGPEALTAMAALLLSVGAEGPGRPTYRACVMRSLVRLAPAPEGDFDYYRSYFLTHALRVAERLETVDMARGRARSSLGELRADELRARVLRRQIKSGPNSGSWSPSDRWGLAGGRVYATAMAALSLQADRRADELVAWVKGASTTSTPSR